MYVAINGEFWLSFCTTAHCFSCWYVLLSSIVAGLQNYCIELKNFWFVVGQKISKVLVQETTRGLRKLVEAKEPLAARMCAEYHM